MDLREKRWETDGFVSRARLNKDDEQGSKDDKKRRPEKG
jgi:hypothetical protein